VNALDNATGDRRTPLHKASAQGHAALVQLLLEHGAREDIRDARGNTASQLAAARERDGTAPESLPAVERAGGVHETIDVASADAGSGRAAAVAPAGAPATQFPKPPYGPPAGFGALCAACGQRVLVLTRVPPCMQCAVCDACLRARRHGVIAMPPDRCPICGGGGGGGGGAHVQQAQTR
jgi:hypothetical protein